MTPEALPSFRERVLVRAEADHIPVFGTLELTARCNLRCVHCYIAPPCAPPRPAAGELSTHELRGIIDQLVELGCLWLTLTGGEPFLRPDLPQIVSYAQERGLVLTLFTNGTLITAESAAWLEELCPHFIEISLYGASPEVHDRITGVPGSHERCLDAVRLLLERGLTLKLKTPVLRQNKHELSAMRALANRLDVPFRVDPMISPALDGDRAPLQHRLGAAEVVQLEQADPRQRSTQQQQLDACGAGAPRPDLLRCSAGLSMFHIDAQGLLSPCIALRSPSYSLRQGTFRQGWEEHLPALRADTETAPTKCHSCDLFALCSRCPGWVEQETGDLAVPADFLCELTRLRAEGLGAPAATNPTQPSDMLRVPDTPER